MTAAAEKPEGRFYNFKNLTPEERLGCLLFISTTDRALYLKPFMLYKHHDGPVESVKGGERFLYLGPVTDFYPNEKIWSVQRQTLFYIAERYLMTSSLVLSLTGS